MEDYDIYYDEQTQNENIRNEWNDWFPNYYPYGG